MTLAKPSARRTLGVCLRQIRADVRLDAVRKVPEAERDADVLTAAMWPSGTTYFISEAARPLLEEIAA